MKTTLHPLATGAMNADQSAACCSDLVGLTQCHPSMKGIL